MKRSGFTEEQIIGNLRERQAGLGAKEPCHNHGVSDVTFYIWQAKDAGMDARKLKALEAENAKRKKLLAEQMMDVSTLKEML